MNSSLPINDPEPVAIPSLLKRRSTPWICAAILALDFFFVLMGSTGRLATIPGLFAGGSGGRSSRILLAAQVQTTSGPKVVIQYSPEWETLLPDNDMETTTAYARLFPTRGGAGLLTPWVVTNGFELSFHTPSSSGEPSLQQKQEFANLLANAIDVDPFYTYTDWSGRLRSGRYSSTNVFPPGIAHDVAMIALGIACVLSIRRSRRHLREVRRVTELAAGRCPTCAYPVTNLRCCPECGETLQ